jgi:UDP-N-acetylmuramate--alanine ligase
MKYRKIHFVGIKGVGMAPLAVIAKESGCIVTGSDVADTYITDAILEKASISPYVGFDPKHIEGVNLVITTGAHGGLSNEEVVAAKEKGIEVWLQGQAVGEFMNGDLFEMSFDGISVAGCHGKTTTTAMIATLLQTNHQDPSYVIGTGLVPSLGSSGHFGTGDYFVAEADEYATEPKVDKTPKFMWQHPKIAVITNIEFDHPDLYEDLDAVREAYERFAHQIAGDGSLLVVNGDDPQVLQLLETYEGEVITFGTDKTNDYIISSYKNGHFRLEVSQEQWMEEFHLELPGLHNIKNATAAIVVGRELGMGKDEMQRGLSAFTGTKRRLEYHGRLSTGALLYDDYAHHPTEIATTVAALKEKYPEKKICLIFQPHTFSRTKLLFEGFVQSLGGADIVMLTDIYPSAREPFDPSVSSKHLSDALEKKGKTIIYIARPSDMVQYVKQNLPQFGNNAILVTMGAGDIYQIAEELLKI